MGRQRFAAALALVSLALGGWRGADGGGAGTGFEWGTPEVVRVGPSTFELRVQLYGAGEVFYVLQSPSFPAPTSEEIVAGGTNGYTPTLAGSITSLGAHEERYVNISGTVDAGGNYSLFVTSLDANSTWEDSVAAQIQFTTCPVCAAGEWAHATRFSCECVSLSSLSGTEFIPGVQQYFAGAPEVEISPVVHINLGRTVPMMDFPGALSPPGHPILLHSIYSQAHFNFTARYGAYDCSTCPFTCQIDLGETKNCSSPQTYDALDDGEHIFTVRATGMDGYSRGKKDYAWSVEAPIRTAYVQRPKPVSGDSAPEFTVSSNKDGHTKCVQRIPLFCPERNVTHEYRLNPANDSVPYTSVGKNFTVTGIMQGLNTVQVRSIVDGDVEELPPVYTWWYDLDEPATMISDGLADASVIFAKSVAYEFWGTDNDTGVDFFECRMTSSGTGGAPTTIDDWYECASPHTVYGTDGYPYTTSGIATVFTFSVRSVDRAGNRDSTPASRTFRVDITLPKEATVTVRAGDVYRNAENHTASAEEDTMSPLGAVVILPEDETTQFFKFTEIVGGGLYKASGACLSCLKCTTCPEEISNGTFITASAANAGTRYMPYPNTYTGDVRASNFSFTVQPSKNSTESGVGGKPITVNFNVTEVNDQPNLKPKLTFCMEPITSMDSRIFNLGTSITEILDHHPGSIDDRFDGPLLKYGVAIIGSDTSHGAWEYTTDMGGNWLPLKYARKKSATLLEADSELKTRIRFIPSDGELGRDTAYWTSLTFSAWDMSDGRASGTFNDPTYSIGTISEYSFYGSTFYGVDVDDNEEGDDNGEAEEPDICAPGFCIPVSNLNNLGPFSSDMGTIALEVLGLPRVSTHRSFVEMTDKEISESVAARKCPGKAAAVQLTPSNCNTTTQYIDIQHPNFRVVEKPPPWTVEMWVKKSAHLSINSLASSVSGVKLLLEQYPGTGRVGVTLENGTALDFNYSTPLNTWTHLAFACEEDSLTLYSSGNAVGILNVSFPMPMSSIGSLQTQSAFTVDEFRAWTRRKPESEIRNEMEMALKGSEPGLYAYLKFDEGCTSSLSSPDLAEGHHPAALVGGAERVAPWIGSCATIEHVEPSFGPSRGAFNVTVRGEGFSPGSKVSMCEFISRSATLTTPAVAHNATFLTCEAPPGTGFSHIAYFDAGIGCRSALHYSEDQIVVYADIQLKRVNNQHGPRVGSSLVNLIGTFPFAEKISCTFYQPFTGDKHSEVRAVEVSPGSYTCEMPPAQAFAAVDVQVGLANSAHESQERFHFQYLDTENVRLVPEVQHNASSIVFSDEGGQIITLNLPGMPKIATAPNYMCGLGTIRPIQALSERGDDMEFVLPASAGEKNISVSADWQMWSEPKSSRTINFVKLPYVEDDLVVHTSNQKITAVLNFPDAVPLPFFCDMANSAHVSFRLGSTFGCSWTRSNPGFTSLRVSFDNKIFQGVRTVLQMKPASVKRSSSLHLSACGSTVVTLNGVDFNDYGLTCSFNGTRSSAEVVSSSLVKCEYMSEGSKDVDQVKFVLTSENSPRDPGPWHGSRRLFLLIGGKLAVRRGVGSRGLPGGGSKVFLDWSGRNTFLGEVPLILTFGTVAVAGTSPQNEFVVPAGTPGRSVLLRASIGFNSPNYLIGSSSFAYTEFPENISPSKDWAYTNGSTSVTFEFKTGLGVDTCLFGTTPATAIALPHGRFLCHTPRHAQGFASMSLISVGGQISSESIFFFVMEPHPIMAIAPQNDAMIVVNGTGIFFKDCFEDTPTYIEGRNFATETHLREELCSMAGDGAAQVHFISSALIACSAGST